MRLRSDPLVWAWGAFAVANVAVMPVFEDWATIPFHLLWVSLTLLYGFRAWSSRATAAIMGTVAVASSVQLLRMAEQSRIEWAELGEVPLMVAVFVAMAWHAQRRQAALEEVRQASERQRNFVRDASHQLRTPITVARGHAELICAASSNPATVADAEIVVGELGRLGSLCDGLMVLAAAGNPWFLELSTLDVADLVGDTVVRWQASADRRWAAQAHADGTVRCDPERLSAAVDALIENALKFTADGDTVGVRATASGDGVAIEVFDTGDGIAPEFLPRAFDRFASADRTGARRGGTGLGLPIVKAIVEAHGGTVSIASTPRAGTAVRLWLPGFTPWPADTAPRPFTLAAEMRPAVLPTE